jgi:hypothetical protein
MLGKCSFNREGPDLLPWHGEWKAAAAVVVARASPGDLYRWRRQRKRVDIYRIYSLPGADLKFRRGKPDNFELGGAN